MAKELDQVRILKKRLRDLANEMGLDLQRFAIDAGDESNDPDIAQAVLFVTEQAMMTNDEIEQKKFDDQFNDLASMLTGPDIEKIAPMKSEAADWLKDD